MAIRSKLLGLDDELVNQLSDPARVLGATLPAEDPPETIDPWADEAPSAPSLRLTAPMQAPRRSLLGLDFAPQTSATRFDTEAPATAAPARLMAAPTVPALGAPVSLGTPLAPRPAAPVASATPARSTFLSAADDALPEPETLGRGTAAPLTAAYDYEPLAGLGDDAQPAEVQASNKGLPGLSGFDPFGTTADESKALERATTRDRRLRIAQGVLGGLGGLVQTIGAASVGANSMGAGLGAGLMGGAAGNYATNANDVRGDIQQRQAQDFRRLQYGQQQEDRAAQREDRDLDRSLRARSVASSEALNAARQEQISQENAQRELDAAAVRGDAAGARRAFEAYVAMTDPNSNGGQNLRALIAAPEFQGMSADTVREQMRLYTTNNRSLGLVSHGGGAGTLQLVTDANGNPRWVSVGGRGRSGGNAPATPLPTSNGAAEPAAEPTVRPRAAGGARRPVAAPASASAPVPGDPVPAAPVGSETVISAQTDPQWLQEVFVRQFGPDFMDNPNARTGYQGYLRQLTARDGSREQVLRAITTDAMTRARNPDAIVPPEHQAQYNAVAGRMGDAERRYIVPYVGIQSNLRRAFERVQSISNIAERTAAETNLFAALHGNAAAAAAFDRATGSHTAVALHSGIARARNSFGRGESGAAINQGEWDLFDSILGRSSSLNDAQDLINGLQGLINRGEAEVQSYGDQSGLPPGVAYDYWTRQHAAAAEARRARRGGGH